MSNEKRRDSKGRLLFEGEQQKKTGRYEYRYYDNSNVRRSIYSWRLTDADPVPKGKQYCKPLREMIREIENDLHDEIDSFVSKSATLNQRFDIYIEDKKKLKESTRQNYVYMYDKNIRNGIGRRAISEINFSVILRFYNELITIKGFKPNSMEIIHTILNSVFDNAVYDKIIRANPCTPAMKKIKERSDWSTRIIDIKKALTATQQKAFIDYMLSAEKYSRWVNVITVLLGTGLRIGECIGLTWSDCDFNNGLIYVRRNLSYRKWEDGKCYFKVMTTKTKKGIRTIPMFDEVRNALLKEKEWQNTYGTANTVIDGISDWVFTNRYGTVLSAGSVNDGIARIVRDYNNDEEQKAIAECRDSHLIPHLTNHILRHCFCTRLMEESSKPQSKITLKVIQDLMGHSKISTTMDIYTDVSKEFQQHTIRNIQGDIYLG